MVKWDGRTVNLRGSAWDLLKGLGMSVFWRGCEGRIRLMLLVRSPSLGAGWNGMFVCPELLASSSKALVRKGTDSFLDFLEKKTGAEVRSCDSHSLVAGTRNSACWCAEKGTLWGFGIFFGRRSDFRFWQISLPG